MSENNISLEAKDQPFEATTYGGLLRIARENKELSIDQVSSQLRISPDQIEGLESDNYKVFPTPVYARAHLRSYARLLGVDEAKIISLFNAALAPDDKDPAPLFAVQLRSWRLTMTLSRKTLSVNLLPGCFSWRL